MLRAPGPPDEEVPLARRAAGCQDEPLHQMWQRVSRRLCAALGDDVFASWFKCIEPVEIRDGIVFLSVPTKFLTNWIQQKYADRILRMFEMEDPTLQRVSMVLRQAGERPQTPRPSITRSLPPPAPLAPASPDIAPARALTPPATESKRAGESITGSPLDARLTFATFHVGRSNMLAHAAAQQVAHGQRKEAPVFNPLYVHAAVGLGKTHLLQAAAQAVEASGRRVLYLTAEKFMYGFVSALKAQTALAFKEALRGIDVLVIDDVQFLHGKTIQQEFCHTLNALIDAGRQVVVAADRPPTDLEGMDERIQSRLARGLVVEIGALDDELRLRILNARVEAAQALHPAFSVPQAVLAHVAELIPTNGRDLEGAANRLLAHATLTGAPLDISSAENAIRDLIKLREPKKVKIEEIQRLVASHFNVSRADILSSRRTATVVRPRQIAMYLAKQLTLRSLPEIGRRFGGRDHTTVLHAVRKIEGLVGNDKELANEIDHLRRMLQE